MIRYHRPPASSARPPAQQAAVRGTAAAHCQKLLPRPVVKVMLLFLLPGDGLLMY